MRRTGVGLLIISFTSEELVVHIGGELLELLPREPGEFLTGGGAGVG